MKLFFFSLRLMPFYRFFSPRILGKYCSLDFVHRFQLFRTLGILQKICFEFCLWDIVDFIFSFFSLEFVFCFGSRSNLDFCIFGPFTKVDDTKLTIIIVKAQINPIIRILIKTMDLFIIIVQSNNLWIRLVSVNKYMLIKYPHTYPFALPSKTL